MAATDKGFRFKYKHMRRAKRRVDLQCRELGLENRRLRNELSTIGSHWPGRWTGRCSACSDLEWPCPTVLAAVEPWMPEDDPGPFGLADERVRAAQ